MRLRGRRAAVWINALALSGNKDTGVNGIIFHIM